MSESYQIIFAGTPVFSVKSLDALIHSGHQVKAVYTQPDRPAGRGRRMTVSPVKAFALQHDLPIYQPDSLKDVHAQHVLQNIAADLMIVVAYGLLLPAPVLTATRLGCVNIHASLLPRWRGAAPIQQAILAGDTVTGITLMQMDAGLDTGAMLYQRKCIIGPHETSAALHDRLAEMGAEVLIYGLDHFSQFTPSPQSHADATYAHKIHKEEAFIHWQESAMELDRKIRGFNPWPVAYTLMGEHIVRIWKAIVLEGQSSDQTPGTIIQAAAQGIDVATGQGVLRLQEVQLAGGKVLAAADLLNARKNAFTVGNQLG